MEKWIKDRTAKRLSPRLECLINDGRIVNGNSVHCWALLNISDKSSSSPVDWRPARDFTMHLAYDVRLCSDDANFDNAVANAESPPQAIVSPGRAMQIESQRPVVPQFRIHKLFAFAAVEIMTGNCIGIENMGKYRLLMFVGAWTEQYAR